MSDSETGIDGKLAMVAAGMVGIVVYGSLFPFDFHARIYGPGALHMLLATYSIRPGRGDTIANILLYMPFGFFAMQALRRRPSFPQVLLVMFAGMALSTSMELIQYYDRGRVTALSDVYSNTAGALLGAIAGAVLHRKLSLPVLDEIKRRPFVLLLVVCWLGYRLFPFEPVIDLHKYWHAIKPLLFAPKLPPLDLYRHAASWLVVALMLEALVGMARSRLAILLLVPAVLCARVFIVGAILSPAEVAGGGLAVLLWAALLWNAHARATAIAAVFAGAVVLQGLEPFQFRAPEHAFGWIPFRSFMHGSIEVNIRSFLEKVFTYGGLVWLCVRAGYRLRGSTVAAGLLVLCLRLTEVYLPGRSAEITDVLLLLALAGVMQLMSEVPAAAVD